MTRMEAGRSFLAQTPALPFPTPSRFKPTGVCTVPATSTWRHFPASVRSLEPRDEVRPLSSPQFMSSEEAEEGSDAEDGERLGPDSDRSRSSRSAYRLTLSTSDGVEIAKMALTASKEAADSLPEGASVDDNFGFTRLGSSIPSSSLLDKVITVRSTKRLQRESVRRKVTILSDIDSYSTSNHTPRKAIAVSHRNNPVRNFLGGLYTTQLLTKKEECKLAEDIQEVLRLEEVKNELELQFGREPTLSEWAECVGLSCYTLKDQLRCGSRSRERLFHCNLRVVVHIAKNYEGHGLSLPDLLQAGNLGLKKSVDRFRPQAECRFASYAYWWVRQSIQQAIQQNARLVYLPVNVYRLQKQVKKAKKSCFGEGNYYPTNEEIARRVGITPQALIKLLRVTQLPGSLNWRVWRDGNIIYQDLIRDPKAVDPHVVFAIKMLERQLLEFVMALPPKESRTIWLRYGLDDGRPKTLIETGKLLGITRERVRQLQKKAMEKVKESISPEEKRAYMALVSTQF